jgi:hypothetical protein
VDIKHLEIRNQRLEDENTDLKNRLRQADKAADQAASLGLWRRNCWARTQRLRMWQPDLQLYQPGGAGSSKTGSARLIKLQIRLPHPQPLCPRPAITPPQTQARVQVSARIRFQASETGRRPSGGLCEAGELSLDTSSARSLCRILYEIPLVIILVSSTAVCERRHLHSTFKVSRHQKPEGGLLGGCARRVNSR